MHTFQTTWQNRSRRYWNSNFDSSSLALSAIKPDRRASLQRQRNNTGTVAAVISCFPTASVPEELVLRDKTFFFLFFFPLCALQSLWKLDYSSCCSDNLTLACEGRRRKDKNKKTFESSHAFPVQPGMLRRANQPGTVCGLVTAPLPLSELSVNTNLVYSHYTWCYVISERVCQRHFLWKRLQTPNDALNFDTIQYFKGFAVYDSDITCLFNKIKEIHFQPCTQTHARTHADSPGGWEEYVCSNLAQ